MSIVVLTIPEEGRLEFVHKLDELTGGGVGLVILQKKVKKGHPFLIQIKNFYDNGGLKNVLMELWCAVLLRFSRRKKQMLDYFRAQDASQNKAKKFSGKIIEVESHNNEQTLSVLKQISPKLLVIWSNTIVGPDIIATAKDVVNLHMGLCPYYRGSVANQYALILEPERLGATVHYVETLVDTGDIIETITADLSKSPKDLFLDLNKRAEKLYLRVIKKLHSGERLSRYPQDKTIGRNFRLKDWTPKVRYRVAKILIDWEKKGILTK